MILLPRLEFHLWVLAALWPDKRKLVHLKAFLPRANGEVGRGSVGKGNFVKLKKAVSLDQIKGKIMEPDVTWREMESQFYLIIFIRFDAC